MAASRKVHVHVGGYQCEFVGAVSEDFVCGICKHVAREPQLTNCCGMTFCSSCITPIMDNRSPCPCGKTDFTAMFSVRDNLRSLALEVRCMMKDRGCAWTGKLEGLEAHLDVDIGDCEYVDVECPNGCDQLIQKRNRASHLTSSCPKREFTCQHCNFKATYEVVSNDHWPQCSFYPVPCPNACGIQAIERGDLEAHLLQCPSEEVECDFSHAGCNTKLPRCELEKHTEEGTQEHLVLMSKMNLKIRREFESKLQQQEDESQRYAKQMNRETTEKFEERIRQVWEILDDKQQQIDALGRKSQESLQAASQEFERTLGDQIRQAAEVTAQLQAKIQKSEAELRELQAKSEAEIQELRLQLQQKTQEVELLHNHMSTALICPSLSNNTLFEMPNFTQHKNQRDYWHSSPMYTHACGYKFSITVWLGAGQGTQMAAYLDALMGEFDSHLKWPAKQTMTLQLLNREKDQDHVAATETFTWEKPTQERCGVKCFGSREEFIAHSDLENVPYSGKLSIHQSLFLPPPKKIQYLKDNRLLFKLELNKPMH